MWREETLKGSDPLGDLGMDGTTVLKCILKVVVVRVRTVFDGSGQGLVAGSCEHGNGLSGLLKGDTFLAS